MWFGMRPDQVSEWCHLPREDKLVLPALPEPEPAFVPMIIEPLTDSSEPLGKAVGRMVEVVVANVVIRLDGAVPAKRIAEIAHALNARS
jgi:transposase